MALGRTRLVIPLLVVLDLLVIIAAGRGGGTRKRRGNTNMTRSVCGSHLDLSIAEHVEDVV